MISISAIRAMVGEELFDRAMEDARREIVEGKSDPGWARRFHEQLNARAWERGSVSIEDAGEILAQSLDMKFDLPTLDELLKK